MRRQSEQTVLELRNELLMSTEQLDKIKETEATLRSQLSFAQQVYLAAQTYFPRLDLFSFLLLGRLALLVKSCFLFQTMVAYKINVLCMAFQLKHVQPLNVKHRS